MVAGPLTRCFCFPGSTRTGLHARSLHVTDGPGQTRIPDRKTHLDIKLHRGPFPVMYGSGTAPGLFSFNRLTALFFSVWASLSSGSNYVCHSFLPSFVLLIFLFLLVCRSSVVSHRSEPSKLSWNAHVLLAERFTPACVPCNLITLSWQRSLSLRCLQFVAFTYLTRVFSSIPSAIRRAS